VLIDIREILEQLSNDRNIQDKVNIDTTYQQLGKDVSLPKHYIKEHNVDPKVKMGDDCSAIPNGTGGYHLLASEGIISDFLLNDPWFAGYSAVMVNISDIFSMGGLPIAVTDVLWGKDSEDLSEVWKGMIAASKAYDVPIVGGHTCYHTQANSLSVSVFGQAKKLLTSFDAQQGDVLLMALDMNGAYYKEYPFWNASSSSLPKDLQRKGALLSQIAEKQWSVTAKDISMGGLFGTLAMLGKTSEVGFEIHFDQLINPPDGDWNKWLRAFPSYGFVLTCKEQFSTKIIDLFNENDIACSTIGTVIEARDILIKTDIETINFTELCQKEF